MVLENYFANIGEITGELDISIESVRLILVYILDLISVHSRLVPTELNFNCREYSEKVCWHMFDGGNCVLKLVVSHASMD